MPASVHQYLNVPTTVHRCFREASVHECLHGLCMCASPPTAACKLMSFFVTTLDARECSYGRPPNLLQVHSACCGPRLSSPAVGKRKLGANSSTTQETSSSDEKPHSPYLGCHIGGVSRCTELSLEKHTDQAERPQLAWILGTHPFSRSMPGKAGRGKAPDRNKQLWSHRSWCSVLCIMLAGPSCTEAIWLTRAGFFSPNLKTLQVLLLDVATCFLSWRPRENYTACRGKSTEVQQEPKRKCPTLIHLNTRSKHVSWSTKM